MLELDWHYYPVSGQHLCCNPADQKSSSPTLLHVGCNPRMLSIWIARNDLIFKGVPQNPGMVKSSFSKELKTLTLRAKAKFSMTFDLWIQNLS
jgi:hypothetical protein